MWKHAVRPVMQLTSFLVLTLALGVAQGPPKLRNLTNIANSSAQVTPAGPYYALIIGNKDYQHLPSLATPVDDAEAVAQLLQAAFGFKTTLLLNGTREQILAAISHFRSLPADSNFVIFYAGHGERSGEDGAYWLPTDAQPQQPATWVSARSITDSVSTLSPRHILIVSDSCYSGAFASGKMRGVHTKIDPQERETALTKILARPQLPCTRFGRSTAFAA